MPNNQNIFISHHGEDEEQIENVRSMLRKHDKEIKNSSIDSSKKNEAQSEEYIKSILRPRINWASAVLVLIGKETHDRDWVNWEIEQANRQGKVVVGLHLNRGENHEIPEALEHYADAVVGWRAERLMDALEGKYQNWETPDGAPRQSPWTPDRSDC